MAVINNENLITSNKYNVRFAQNEEDVKAAQHLRFKVFNLELGEGLSSSYEQQLDVDDFDNQCHHLLVIEKGQGDVIGTYRMQTYRMAQKGKGLYTSEEFDLSSIPGEILDKSIEVGRACIAKEHRNGRVLYLLWRGLAEYMSKMKSRYLFGCCSITSQDPAEGWQVMKYLKQKNHLHPDVMVDTTEPFKCKKVEDGKTEWEGSELPQLFRLYMDLGAKVCSPPAIDRNFKTIDYLVLLDVEKLDERTKLLFFK